MQLALKLASPGTIGQLLYGVPLAGYELRRFASQSLAVFTSSKSDTPSLSESAFSGSVHHQASCVLVSPSPSSSMEDSAFKPARCSGDNACIIARSGA